MFTRDDSPHHCICRPGWLTDTRSLKLGFPLHAFVRSWFRLAGLLSRLIGHIKESDDVSLIASPHKLGEILSEY